MARVLLHAAAAALAARASGAAPAGLYGLTDSQTVPASSLVWIAPNGTAVPRGPPLPAELVPGQGLSSLDARAATLFAVLFNTTAQAYALVGVSLDSGAVTSYVPLPFAVDTFIGLGVTLSLNTSAAPTVAYVGGENAAGVHEFASLTAATGGDYAPFASLPASWNPGPGCSSAYVPGTHSILVQFNVDVNATAAARHRARAPAARRAPRRAAGAPTSGEFELGVYSVSVATGAVRLVNESFDSAGRDIQSLSGYDAVTGHVFGVGVAATPGGGWAREVVELDPVRLSIAVVGGVAVDTVDDGGITAFNPAHRSLYWIGDRGGSDTYYLLENGVGAGAPLLSRVPLCAYDECPATLDYYAGPAAA